MIPRGGFSLIAGPCVIESEEHCLYLARAIRDAVGPFIFKASFDKANRSSVHSYRGPGLDQGLRILASVRALGLPILTDIHEPSQAGPAAEVADILQIPAFLCRQTDLLIAAGRTGRTVNVKKGQFLAPQDMIHVVEKIRSTGNQDIVLTERGSSFGYNNLVVDMLAIGEMHRLGVPVTIDATHAVQLPGADPRTSGGSTGGRREGVPVIARAAVASGADGVFLEFHTDPDKALCDGPSCLPLDSAERLLTQLKAIRAAVA
ncbi:MAG: 3-deoxy-8-phosphooctulonate synthase [Acidobacteriota bacterium]